jgi:hypothetical protein
MRGALAPALATAVVVAASASAASDAGPWQVVRSKTVRGELAIAATQATIRRPKGIGSSAAAWPSTPAARVKRLELESPLQQFRVLRPALHPRQGHLRRDRQRQQPRPRGRHDLQGKVVARVT